MIVLKYRIVRHQSKFLPRGIIFLPTVQFLQNMLCNSQFSKNWGKKYITRKIRHLHNLLPLYRGLCQRRGTMGLGCCDKLSLPPIPVMEKRIKWLRVCTEPSMRESDSKNTEWFFSNTFYYFKPFITIVDKPHLQMLSFILC